MKLFAQVLARDGAARGELDRLEGPINLKLHRTRDGIRDGPAA